MLIVDVAWCGFIVLAAGHAVGVNPCVQFHATLVGLLYHELQGIPYGTRCLARLTREPTAPGLDVADVGSIGLRAYLPYDGIAVSLLQEVQLLNQILTGLLGCHLSILLLTDDVHPRTTELMLGQ